MHLRILKRDEPYGILLIAGRSAEVAHLSWAQGVAGSNPVAPTRKAGVKPAFFHLSRVVCSIIFQARI